MRALAELADLVAERTCAGCDRPGTRWCPACAAGLAGPLLRSARGELPVWAVTTYGGAVREALNRWKDHDRADLDRVLATALADVLTELDPHRHAVLVPVPSSAAARRRRGRWPVRDLCLRLRPRRTVLPALRQARAVQDQSGLGVAERAANLAGALQVRRGWQPQLLERPVLVVDDVVTSGATVTEAATTLRAAGAQVRGVVCVAAATRRG